MEFHWIRGRRKHVCEWCGEEIVAGEDHFRLRGVWQGRRQDWRMHGECYDASEREEKSDEGFEPYTRKRGKTLLESRRPPDPPRLVRLGKPK